MLKKFLFTCLILTIAISSCGFKNRKGYLYDNHRFNYIRLEKIGDIKGEINHPYTFTQPQISTILRMIEIKKGIVFTDREQEKTVFDEYSISLLTPYIVKAFETATPKQKVAFSFLIKDPKFVIKNDRLNTGSMWVEDGNLHIDFDLIYVKVSGDTDKRGYEAMRRTVQSARGLRVTLELGPGQEYGESTSELVVDLGVAEKITDEKIKQEKALAEMGIDQNVKVEVTKEKSVKSRMKELEALKKQKLITDEEYNLKRKEILEGL